MTYSTNGGRLGLHQRQPRESTSWTGAVRGEGEGVGRGSALGGCGSGDGGETVQVWGGGEVVSRTCRFFFIVKPRFLIFIQLSGITTESTGTIKNAHLPVAWKERQPSSDRLASPFSHHICAQLIHRGHTWTHDE